VIGLNQIQNYEFGGGFVSGASSILVDAGCGKVLDVEVSAYLRVLMVSMVGYWGRMKM
jgi:hypothetical protein